MAMKKTLSVLAFALATAHATAFGAGGVSGPGQAPPTLPPEAPRWSGPTAGELINAPGPGPVTATFLGGNDDDPRPCYFFQINNNPLWYAIPMMPHGGMLPDPPNTTLMRPAYAQEVNEVNITYFAGPSAILSFVWSGRLLPNCSNSPWLEGLVKGTPR